MSRHSCILEHFTEQMDTRKVLNWHLKILRVLGLWPEPDDSIGYSIRSIVLGLFLFMSYPLFQFACVFFVNSVDDAVVILLLSSTMVTTVMKVYIVKSNRGTFADLLTLMQEMDQTISFSEHELFFVPIFQQCKLMFITFCSICYSSWVLLVLQTIVSPPESRLYLSTYLYPIEVLHLPIIYYGGLIYEAASNSIFIAVTQAVDLFGPSLLHVLGGNIDILCKRLQFYGTKKRNLHQQKTELVQLCRMYLRIIRYDPSFHMECHPF